MNKISAVRCHATVVLTRGMARRSVSCQGPVRRSCAPAPKDSAGNCAGRHSRPGNCQHLRV